jgi:hypothetical protein
MRLRTLPDIGAHRLARRLPVALMAIVAFAPAILRGQSPMDEGSAGRRRDRVYVVRGIDDPDPTELARALAADDGLLLQSGPRTTRKAFLAAVTSRARLALQREGFAAAEATAAIETTATGDEVVVTVVPGDRTMAAGIEITGLPADLASDLRRWLKGERPPPGAVPQAFETEGGWSGTRWLDPAGQPARMEGPLWNPDHPAAFDEPHLQATRAAVTRFFRDRGFFAAARLLDRRTTAARDPAEPAVTVTVRPEPDGAVLVIDAVQLPPASVLDDIELYAGARVTKDDLARILGITVGGPVTERDRLAWRESLRLSGRFIRQEVKFKEAPPAAPGGPPRITAIFDLAPYPPATPLATEPTREEAAALRVRTWLLQTLADDDDLVITWTPPGPLAATRPLGTLVVSTRQGLLLTSLPGGPDASGVAISGGGIGWFLPHGAGWFEVPVPSRERLAIDVAVSLSDSVEAGLHEYARGVTVGYGLEPRPRDADAAVVVTARIAPVACLALVHEGKPALTWEGDTLVVARDEATVRIDSRTGRIESLRLPDGGTFAVDAAAGRLAADMTSLRAAAGADATRPDALVSSGVAFLAGEPMRKSLMRLAEAAGLAEVAAAWEERVSVVADELARVAASGALAATDRAVAEALAASADHAARPGLAIPSPVPTDGAADPWATLTRRAAALAWRLTECTCGRDAWPAALARLATFAAVGDSSALWELTGYMTDVRNGPLAQLVASAVAPTPEMAASFSRQGLAKLAPEAFRHDCQPVLECLGHCGLDQAAVAILRGLDDDQARHLGQSLVGDPDGLLPLVRRLRGSATDAAAVAAVPETLDVWWRESLRGIVEGALAARATAPAAEETADAPR